MFIKYLSVKQCKISNGSSEIYPIHSFGDDVCFDSNRKNIWIWIRVNSHRLGRWDLVNLNEFHNLKKTSSWADKIREDCWFQHEIISIHFGWNHWWKLYSTAANQLRHHDDISFKWCSKSSKCLQLLYQRDLRTLDVYSWNLY